MRVIAVMLCLAVSACAVSPPAPRPVRILVSAPDASGAGTGFFVSRDGAVVTAAHAVAGCRRVDVASARLPRTAARPLLLDMATDLAVLRADGVRAPGVLAVGRTASAARPEGAFDGTAYGYAGTPAAALDEASAENVTGQVRVRAEDPRFALWWRNPRIGHGWSGGPVARDGKVLGVVLSVLPDLAETERVFGTPQRGIAAGADAASVRALLRRAGIVSDMPEAPERAVVRVFCVAGPRAGL